MVVVLMVEVLRVVVLRAVVVFVVDRHLDLVVDAESGGHAVVELRPLEDGGGNVNMVHLNQVVPAGFHQS